MIDSTLTQIEKKWPRLYLAMVHHRTTNGEPMTFKDKPWLVDLYKDEAHKITVVKASQIHVTEHFLVTMFSLAKQGKRGMYILPSDNWRNLFVADRIDKLCDYSPFYKSAIGATDGEADTRQYKSIFGQGWKFVGSKQRNNFFEFPCSVLMIDECDRNDQDNLVYAYDRLANEPNPYIYKYGNPTTDGFGIAKDWLESDQKEWFVTCEHCGHEQQLDWWKNFVDTDKVVWFLRFADGSPECVHCHKAFNRLGKGRWIKQNPQSMESGYRISRLFAYKKPTDIQDLFKMFLEGLANATVMQNFCNNYLAIFFQDKGAKITREDLMRCAQAVVAPSSRSKIRCIAGIDQGRNFTISISRVKDGRRIKMYLGNVRTWDEVHGLLDAYDVDTVVVDASGGGYAETREFVAKRTGAWMCYYVPKDKVTKQYELKYEENVVYANRTETLDLMVADYKQRNISIPLDYANILNGEFVDEMMMPTRVLDAGMRPVWTKGKDHFFHADGYEKLALAISGMFNSETVARSWRASRVSNER